MTSRVVLALGILLLAGCASSAPPAGSTAAGTGAAAADQTAAPTFAEQALVEELVLSNRILASRESGVFDSQGQVSVRSQTNPNHYYISRWVAPGLVTLSDIIENDLDSKPVAGERTDQYPENILHGEIYKARPEVMAVVHVHTPEVVAFSVSSVPINDQNPAPIFPQGAEFDNPEVVKALIAQMGKKNSILAQGHGAVLTGTSLQGAVNSANGLRGSARRKMMEVGLGGTVNPNPRGTLPEPPELQQQPAAGFAGRSGPARSWENWKRMITVENGGRVPAAPAPTQKVAPRSKESIVEDLVLANRILSSPELGVLDGLGHISVRNPNNPDRFFISRAVSAASVTAADILENDLDAEAVGGHRDDEFQEIYLHSGIYKARPDVMAVMHAHTPELVVFSANSVGMGVVYNGAGFIGANLKNWVIGKYDKYENVVSTPALGAAMSKDMGNDTVMLLAGHGVALAAPSVYDLVSYANDLRRNAQIQQQAILLRGRVNFIPAPAPQPGNGGASSPDGSGGGRRAAERAWEFWRQTLKIRD